MDKTLFDDTIEEPMPYEYMKDKEVLYVQDQNGGSYNGQITLDTSILANSGKWCDYKDAHFQIPYIIAIKDSVDASATGVINPFIAGLKNGHYQIIDSIQVDYNNTNVIQLQPFTNFYVNYKVLSSWSSDDLAKHGTMCGVSPDTAGSFRQSLAVSKNTEGITNNIVLADATSNPLWQGGAQDSDSVLNTSLDEHNEGYYQRLKTQAFNTNIAGTDTSYGGLRILTTSGQLTKAGKSFLSGQGAGADRIYKFNIIATVRLKDLSDLFEKMPLVKGAFFRFTINYNAFNTVLTRAVGVSYTHATITAVAGRTNPVMWSSGEADQPAAANLALADGTVSISSGVVKATISNTTVTVDGLTSVRLYVPCYELDEMREKELLLMGKRTVRYNGNFCCCLRHIESFR